MTTAGKMWERFQAFWDRINGGIAVIAYVFLAIMVLTTLFIIIARIPGEYFWGTNELIMASMLSVVFLTMAWTQVQKKHIEVNLITRRFPPRLRHISRISALLVCLFFFTTFMVKEWSDMVTSYVGGDLLFYTGYDFPGWSIKAVISVGITLMFIQLLRDLIEEIRRPIVGINETET